VTECQLIRPNVCFKPVNMFVNPRPASTIDSFKSVIIILPSGAYCQHLGNTKHNNMRIQTVLLSAMLAVAWFGAAAQGNTKRIIGAVTDIQNNAIAGATIQLLDAKDSAVIKTTAAAYNGRFVFKGLPSGRYVIAVNSTGYEKYASSIVAIDDLHTAILMPAIVLRPTAGQTLKAVTVASRKPLLERKIDRTIVNVDAMISAAGSNALEVLARSPGVMVDINGDISLNGVHGVLVLIDDRPTYMSVQDLAAYLRSLPGSMLDKIELMASPPAKYDAAGNAIINIVLKKNRAAGFNGNISTGYNQGVYGHTNDAANVNYRHDKINIFGNAGYSTDRNFNDETFNRTFYNAGGQVSATGLMNSFYYYSSQSANIRAGMDYFASPKTTLGILVTAGTRQRTDSRNYLASQYDGNKYLDSVTKGSASGTYQWRNEGVNLNFQHKFDSVGTLVTADFDYVHYHSNGSQLSPDSVYLPGGTLINTNNILDILPSNINIWSAKADYTRPLKGNAKFEAGIKSSYVVTDNSTNWFNETGSAIVPDYANTNHFIYRENINAAYISAEKEWKRWALKAGLRAENTQAEGHQLGNTAVKDSSFNKSYTILFPTAYLLYKLDRDGNNTIKLSYGLRVRRPNYQQLNPFLLYRDAYTYSAGNPYLNPVLNHVFALEYAYKGMFGISMAYLHIKNDVYNLTQASGQVLITKPENFGTDYSFNIKPYVSLSPVKGWNLDAGFLLFKLVNNGNAYGQLIHNSITTGEVEVNNQFRLKHGWSAELNSFFPGRMGTAQTYSDATWRVDGGLQKIILNNKGSIRVSMNDIFHSLKFGDKTIIPVVLTAVHTNITDTRRVNISFNYRFGKDANARKRNHNNGGAADEQGRTD